MPFSILTIIAGAVVAYFIVMFIMHKLFEKFFMILFFILSMLFVVGVIYLMLKGV